MSVRVLLGTVVGFNGPQRGPESAYTWNVRYREESGSIVTIAAEHSFARWPDDVDIDPSRTVGRRALLVLEGEQLTVLVPTLPAIGPCEGDGFDSAAALAPGAPSLPLPPIQPPPTVPPESIPALGGEV